MAFYKCGGSPSLEQLRPVEVAEEFDELRDDTGPARLVAGAQARAIGTVEIFVEQDVIFPLRISLKFLCTAVAQIIAVCRRSKMVSIGTRRPRKDSRLCKQYFGQKLGCPFGNDAIVTKRFACIWVSSKHQCATLGFQCLLTVVL